MLFNSFSFLIFFPLAVLSYYIVPKRLQNVWLLALNYFFYMSWNAKYGLLLIGCTVISYFTGLGIEKSADAGKKRNARKILLLVIVLLTAVLCIFKYTNFVINNINQICSILHIERTYQLFDIVMPVGISFYSLEVIGYLADVCQGRLSAERNFVRYALFVSFFPQILSGPIERGGHMLGQFGKPRKFSYEAVRSGLFIMLYGYFLKLVIADRTAIFVNRIFDDLPKYSGAAIVLATILYGLQIYCDFYGYSAMALGAGRILGIEIIDNFNCPYFSRSPQEFWRRWHISLSTWLRDYIYFPLGGSRCSKARSCFNLLVTFLVSGLWHGSQWTFIVWGLLNGLYQVVGKITGQGQTALCKNAGTRTESRGYQAVQMIVTFLLIDFAWMFFRMGSLSDFPYVLKKVFLDFRPLSVCGPTLFSYGLDRPNCCLLLFSVLILFFADVCKYKGICLSDRICGKNWVFRAIFLAAAVLFIVLTGIWGNAYHAGSFIYFKF